MNPLNWGASADGYIIHNWLAYTDELNTRLTDGNHHRKAAMPVVKHEPKYIDPVCGLSVDPSRTPAQLCYNGIQFYFCSAGCMKTFDAAPQNFTASQSMGYWHRYLLRLKKTSGGRPPACH